MRDVNSFFEKHTRGERFVLRSLFMFIVSFFDRRGR